SSACPCVLRPPPPRPSFNLGLTFGLLRAYSRCSPAGLEECSGSSLRPQYLLEHTHATRPALITAFCSYHELRASQTCDDCFCSCSRRNHHALWLPGHRFAHERSIPQCSGCRSGRGHNIRGRDLSDCRGIRCLPFYGYNARSDSACDPSRGCLCLPLRPAPDHEGRWRSRIRCLGNLYTRWQRTGHVRRRRLGRRRGDGDDYILRRRGSVLHSDH
ncbi:hypothetical protein B0H15DRAFT_462876, partial [Mycena belliarum]